METKINQADPLGRKQGYWEYYYKNGKIEKKGHYINNKREGIWTSYYINGLPRAEITYKEDQREGISKGYLNKNGISVLSDQIEYKNGKKTGLAKYWDINGNPTEQGAYKEDRKVGIWMENYSYGIPEINSYETPNQKHKLSIRFTKLLLLFTAATSFDINKLFSKD